MAVLDTIEVKQLREPTVAYGKSRFNPSEYLEMENAAAEKHEYYRGEIFAMAGAKLSHNNVAGNLFAVLWNKLNGKPCRPYNSDTRIHVVTNSLFTYPDVSVVCGDVETFDNDGYNVVNPTVIFEVLSPSTREYDRNMKFSLYKDIPTLKEYVLVEPQQVLVEAYRINEDGKWEMEEYSDITKSMKLSSIKVSISLSDVYRKIAFTDHNIKSKQ